jgi:hypothetical protein
VPVLALTSEIAPSGVVPEPVVSGGALEEPPVGAAGSEEDADVVGAGSLVLEVVVDEPVPGGSEVVVVLAGGVEAVLGVPVPVGVDDELEVVLGGSVDVLGGVVVVVGAGAVAVDVGGVDVGVVVSEIGWVALPTAWVVVCVVDPASDPPVGAVTPRAAKTVEGETSRLSNVPTIAIAIAVPLPSSRLRIRNIPCTSRAFARPGSRIPTTAAGKPEIGQFAAVRLE